MSSQDFDEYRKAKPGALIKAALDLIHDPGEVVEVRIPGSRGRTVSGYFNDFTVAALAVVKENGKHQALYATVNPIKPSLLARNHNKLEYGSVTTTSDSEIEKRRWFLLDFDPARPAGISSTDIEVERSKELAYMVIEWLTSIGWPKPMVAESGNGVHVMYRVDEPNDDPARVDFEFATKMLSSLFSTSEVLVDTTSFNASRVWKIYGTVSAKGSSTSERPHRVAKIIEVPEEFQLVTRDQLDALARPLRDAKPDEFRNMAGEFIEDMVKWLADRGATVVSGPRPMFGNEGQKWLISKCPFNPEHQSPMVGLVNNRPVYRCLHNSCSAFRWKEFREKIDPSYKDPVTVAARLREWCDSDSATPDQELLQAACATQRKLDGMLKVLRKEVGRDRFMVLEEAIRTEKRRYIRDTVGENNEKGNIVGLINRVRAFQADGAVQPYWVADFDHRARIGPVGDIECPKITEEDEIDLLVKFHALGDTWVKQTHAAQIIKYISVERKVNPLKVYLKRKTWDGIKRIDTWLPDYLATKDSVYTRAIGRKWLISAVARAMDPGCQADHMLILEGAQGIGKSKALRALGGQFYTEYQGGIKAGMNTQRDMVAVIVGKMIVEMSELAAMRKADMESLKATLTTTVDDVRLSYERDAKAYPRTCVFAGTTNEVGQTYISDITGARRFWPVLAGETGPVRSVELEMSVDQIWAEAVEAYESGEDWWSVPADVVAAEQGARQVTLEDSDPWFARVRSCLTDPDSYGDILHVVPEYTDGQLTTGFVVRAGAMHVMLQGILGVDVSRQTAADVARVQKILKAVGFKRSRPSRGWLGSSYAYDLTRASVPHLWSSIIAAKSAVPFPKQVSEDQDSE